ncbi:aspartate/glutamate racemase family protein [Microbacterium panaciterrae]|uniref:Aspartate/glutamate racemase family protein n=2 Tax=Microbacterium panaciterrae TaxID=985759 RepID=A0ABP8NYR5_9MICO
MRTEAAGIGSMAVAAPGPTHRLGVLAPSSNSNAESSIQRMLDGQHDVAAHVSRFRLPPALSDRIDADVLGDAPALLADVEPDAVAFHGTSGSWTGFPGDRDLCAQLERVVGAPATTATLAVRAAIDALGVRRVGLVFPGPPAIAERIAQQYAADGVEMPVLSAPDVELANAEIARVGADWIDALMRPAFREDIDAVVCVGTNLRSAYRVAAFEAEYGIPVIDSATATLWHLLRLAGAARPITGWGLLLQG